MSSATLVARASLNGNHRPEVIKRDCCRVSYQQSKIVLAVTRCLVNSCNYSPEAARSAATSVCLRVDRLVAAMHQDEITIEEVQDLVEQQLMAEGLYEPARQYILYREEHRRLRDELLQSRPSVFKQRRAFKPFEFPEVTQYKDAINNSFWLVSEWNFTGDVHEFQTKLTDVDRSAIRNAILAISQIEVAVKRFWARLGDRFPKPEFEQVGITFAESEIRHADAYSQLLSVLGLEQDFTNINEVPAIRDRVRYLNDVIKNSGSASHQEYVTVLSLFTLFVENVSLFSQFAVIKSFSRHRQALKDVDNVVQATQQEERIHALFGAALVRYIQDEHPEWFGPEFYAVIYESARQALVIETQLIDWIMEAGELTFLSKRALVEFVKLRINSSLEMIGGTAQFDVDHAALAELAWFVEELDADVDCDFFHKRPVTYSSKSKSITAQDLF